MLQEVELLIKWLLPTLGEGEAELQRPREQQLLKETGPHSEPLRESCRRLAELLLPTSSVSSQVKLRIYPVFWGSLMEPLSGREAS